jgi:hypothetical protein
MSGISRRPAIVSFIICLGVEFYTSVALGRIESFYTTEQSIVLR